MTESYIAQLDTTDGLLLVVGLSSPHLKDVVDAPHGIRFDTKAVTVVVVNAEETSVHDIRIRLRDNNVGGTLDVAFFADRPVQHKLDA